MSAAPRLAALDRLRGFVIVLVVLHHSVLAYCTFGRVDRINYALSTAPIVDGARWIGFDLVVKLNDGFFMPLLFLLSGLFAADSVRRKGPVGFLRGRAVRLLAPFALAELTLVPLAYYPSSLQAGGPPGFGAFWLRTITEGPWPSGPPWFLAVLFVYALFAALAFARQSPPAPVAQGQTPLSCFLALLVVSALVYIPLLAIFGPYRWVALGPVAVQGSRMLLYGGYFAAGAYIGRGGRVALADFAATLARQWVIWVAIAALAAVAFVAAASRANWTGLAFIVYCAASCFAVSAVFLRATGGAGPAWTSLAASGFTIYLVHYPIVTWLQYALLSRSFTAEVKALITFSAALATSWLLAAVIDFAAGKFHSRRMEGS